MEFFQNLFSNISSEDSIFFLGSTILSFLLGFIIAAIGWGSRASRRKAEIAHLRKNYQNLEAENQRLQEQIDLKQVDLLKAEKEAEDALLHSSQMQKQQEQFHLEIRTLTEERDHYQSLATSYVDDIDALNNQIVGLKTRNSQLSTDVASEGEAMNHLMSLQSAHDTTLKRLNELENKLEGKTVSTDDETIKSLEEKIEKLTNEQSQLYKSIEKGEGKSSIAVLENKIKQLTQQNEDFTKQLAAIASTKSGSDSREKISQLVAEQETIKEELKSIKSRTESLTLATVATDKNTIMGDMAANEIEVETTEQNARVEAAKKRVQKSIGSSISKANATDKDDLTIIKGIGSFIEQKLNTLGIFTFQQISEWNEAIIQDMTTAIEFFPGRIERDDWVGQARQLIQTEKEQPKKMVKSIYPEDVEDLKIIEGIGPNIEKVLKKAGINSWEELANTPIKKLKSILADAGDSFRSQDPSTWTKQARMAADWKWTELKDYQDELVGGRDLK